MELGPYLRRCLLGGLGLAAIFAGEFLFIWLLYRFFKPLLSRNKPKEQRPPDRKHPLFPMSGRARVAYMILCLENAIRYFGLENWEQVLERLWGLTETTEEVGFPQLFRVCAVLPINILPYERWKDLETDVLEEDLIDYFDGRPGVTEEEFRYLKELYQAAGWRLCVLDPLLQTAYKVTAASWVEGRKEFDGLVLEQVEYAERLLEGWNIPLPELPPALLRQTARGWGKPFSRREIE